MHEQDILQFDRLLPLSALEEVNTAEGNVGVVLAAARTTHALFSKLRVNSFQVSQIENLAADLKATFALVRREIQHQHPRFDFGGRRVATDRERLPVRFKRADHPSLCPLTLFLNQVARALNEIEIVFSKDDQQGRENVKDDWGRLRPLYNIMIKLGRCFRKPVPKGQERAKQNIWPGVAQCILFHEHHSAYTVTSSAARYETLTGMCNFSREVRSNYIRRMRNECPPEVQRRIEEVETGSSDVYHHFHVLTPRDQEWYDWQSPFAPPHGAKARVDGTGATFDPEGHYKRACMTDYHRFDMGKPRGALHREGKKGKRPPFPADTCAEWELFVTKLLAPGRQTSPTYPENVAKPPGVGKSGTYPKHAGPYSSNYVLSNHKTNGWVAPPGWEPPRGRWQPPPQRGRTPQQPAVPQTLGAKPSRSRILSPAPSKKVKRGRTCCFF